MKKNTLKIIAISLILLIICLISFVGIYQKKLNRMENVLPDFQVGMEFGTTRAVGFAIDDSTETIYLDENGNQVEHTHEEGEEHSDEEEKITEKEVPVNAQEVLNSENYVKVKSIMQKRLSGMEAPDYFIRQTENGNISLQLREDDNTDAYIEVLANKGHFEIKDSETNEVLLNNSNIKDAGAVTYTDDSGYIHVYLIVNFDEEGKAKLAEISKTYVETTDEEGNTSSKNVLITIDDETLMNTYFGEAMETGQIQIPIGEATTSVSAITEYIREGHIIATILNSGELPIQYKISHNDTFDSPITESTIIAMIIVAVVIVAVMVLYVIARYRLRGLLASISWMGLIATLFLVLRYTNCILSINSLVAIIIVAVFDYLYLNARLHNKEGRSGKDIFLRYTIMGIPMDIIAIVFVFATALPVSSFGMALFWGNVLILFYNAIVTSNLLQEK